jgi:protein-S-isoprenylcysteine O-methyltransferase Ste14
MWGFPRLSDRDGKFPGGIVEQTAHVILRRAMALAYGLICHILFVASVGLMIWHMYFGMSRSLGALSWPWSWVINAILLLQLPLLHSFMLSKRGRATLKHLAPKKYADDLSTTIYVILASLQVLLLFNFWTFSGTVWWESTGPTFGILVSLYTASWMLLGIAILNAGITLQTGSLGWWAVFTGTKPVYPGMPVRGLFKFLRQPIYLAFACTVWTVPTWTPDQLVIAMALSGYCLVGPLFKEARFTKIHGAKFTDYQNTHPYWLPFPRRTTVASRNDLTIYDRHADQWWNGSQRWLRTLQNLVPARFADFDKHVAWQGKSILDLGCGGGFMSEALAGAAPV